MRWERCFMMARGGNIDYKSAIKWFELAAKQDNTNVMYMLGCMYYEALLLILKKRDIGIAKEHIRVAANKDHRDARGKVGRN